MRAFRDGKDAVFYGETLEQDKTGVRRERDQQRSTQYTSLISPPGKLGALGPNSTSHWATSYGFTSYRCRRAMTSLSSSEGRLEISIALSLFRAAAQDPSGHLFALTLGLRLYGRRQE